MDAVCQVCPRVEAAAQEEHNGKRPSKKASRRRTVGEKITLVKKLQDTASACLREGIIEEAGQSVDLLPVVRQLQDAGFALLHTADSKSSKGHKKADAPDSQIAEGAGAEVATPVAEAEPGQVPQPESEAESEDPAEVPRAKMKCASPACPYRVHTNKDYGSYCCILCFETQRDHSTHCERARLVVDKDGEGADGEGQNSSNNKEAEVEGKTDKEGKEAEEEAPKIKQETPGKKEQGPELSKEEKETKKVIEEVRKLANKMKDTAVALLNLQALQEQGNPAGSAEASKAENGKAAETRGKPEDKLTLATTLQDIASVLLKQGAIEEGSRVAKKLQDTAFEFLQQDVKAEQEAALSSEKGELKHADTALQEEKKKTPDDWRKEVAKQRRVRDNPELPQTLQDAAQAFLKESLPEESRQHAQEAIALYRKLGSRWRLGVCLDIFAKAHLKLREGIVATTNDEKRKEEHVAQALKAADEAVKLLRNIGHSCEEESLASARTTLAEVRGLDGAGDSAKTKDKKAPSKSKKDTSNSSHADAALWREEVAKHRAFYERAPHGRGDAETFASCLLAAAHVVLKDGSVEEALQWADEAAALFRKMGSIQRFSRALDMVARAHLLLFLEGGSTGEANELRERQHLLKAKTAAMQAVCQLSKSKSPEWMHDLESARCTLSRARALESTGKDGTGVRKAGDGLQLKRTFGYAVGLEKPPSYARFDIRDEVCLQVGGFKHGQIVKDGDKYKYVVLGVKLAEEHKYVKSTDRFESMPQLWFQPKSLNKPASCCFMGVTPAGLKALFTATGQETLAEAKSEEYDADEDSEGEPVTLCHECLLPLGAAKYACVDCEGFLHGECMARALLDARESEYKTKYVEDGRKKAKDRVEYNIGWRPGTMVPKNDDFLRERKIMRPPGATPDSMYCLALDGSDPPKLRLLQTKDPEAAVNLHYLVTSLQVRIKAGLAPYFSLDTPRVDEDWQVKTFGPPWLKGTLVGEVLFQADYHLKELSMGDSLFQQPVVGMKNVWDFPWQADSWRAREWFVVKDARVALSENNILIPYVKMGVEAREQVANEKKQLVDAPVTKKSHPLVKYAEVFSHYFELIAERKSVVYHLREVSRAAIAAKFLVDNKVVMDDFWLKAQEETGVCKMDLPFNKQEQFRYEVLVTDGLINQQGLHLTSMQEVCGGVDLNIDAFDLKMPIKLNRSIEAPNYAAIYAEQGQLGAPADLDKLSQRELRRLIQEAGGQLPVGPAEKSDLIQLLLSLRPLGAEGQDEAAEEQIAEEALECQAELEEDFRELALSDEQVRGVIAAILARAKAGGKEKKDAPGDKKNFWDSLEDGTPEGDVLKAVYSKRFSDRREDRALFIPPVNKESYRETLKELVSEERQTQEKRRNHFCSKEFVPGAPGDLFPSAWKPAFALIQARGSSVAAGGEAARGRQLEVSEEDGNALIQVVKPFFDKSTPEDGVRFRIYRRGSVEVRTVQEEGGEETVGSVFHVGAGAPPSERHPVVKVTLFVRSSRQDDDARRAEAAAPAASEDEGRPPAKTQYRYFVVYETDLADVIVTEQVGDATAVWEGNPADMEERYSHSRVLRVSDCSTTGTTVKDLREHYERASASSSSRVSARRYAQSAFDRAGGKPLMVPGPGGVVQLPSMALSQRQVQPQPQEPRSRLPPQPVRSAPAQPRPAIPGKASAVVPLPFRPKPRIH